MTSDGGGVVPLAILQDKRLLGRVPLETRLRVGSAEDCQIRLRDGALPAHWGVIFRRGERVYAQEESGSVVELEPGDALVLGPYVIARADPGTRMGRLAARHEIGDTLPFGKEPFRRVVLTGAASRAAWMQQRGGVGAAGTVRRSSTETRGVRTRSGDGQVYYGCEPLFSQAVDRTLALAIRPLEGRSEDPGALERLGRELLDAMLRLSYPEVVALLQRMATGYQENYLEHLYQRVLNRSPMLAFRWSLVLVERYVEAARTIGRRIELPDLRIGLASLVSPDALEAYRKARTEGAKIAARGPW
ncbi:MAG: hypothetical protein D6776_09460 [Planctomycetota bacterium]|nr:MAG: hypothetical protein D6776_09460 [Planctomycetota bacterium]